MSRSEPFKEQTILQESKVFLSYVHSLKMSLKKFAILKKGIGIESQNLCKQFNDQKTI